MAVMAVVVMVVVMVVVVVVVVARPLQGWARSLLAPARFVAPR
jgi:hypothetical protein